MHVKAEYISDDTCCNNIACQMIKLYSSVRMGCSWNYWAEYRYVVFKPILQSSDQPAQLELPQGTSSINVRKKYCQMHAKKRDSFPTTPAAAILFDARSDAHAVFLYRRMNCWELLYGGRDVRFDLRFTCMCFRWRLHASGVMSEQT